MAKYSSSGKGMSKAGKGGATSGGGMPSTSGKGGVNLGTFRGNHNVAHPVQGGSNAQSIARRGNVS